MSLKPCLRASVVNCFHLHSSEICFKKTSARKSRPQKKNDNDNAVEFDVRAFRMAGYGDFLSSKVFKAALGESGFIEIATAAFREQHIRETSFFVELGSVTQETYDVLLDRAVKEFRDKLPDALYGAALIIAMQASTPLLSKSSVKKKVIRALTDWIFIYRDKQTQIADGRGRKPHISNVDVWQAVWNRGADASRKGVAYDLGVSEKTLNDWRIEYNYSPWKAAVEHLGTIGAHHRRIKSFLLALASAL